MHPHANVPRLPLLLVLVSGLHSQSASFQWIHQIGGSQGQTVAGLAADSQGNIYVAGNTTSTDFPTQSALQPHPGGSGLFRIDGPGAQWQNLYQSGLSSTEWISSDPRNPNTIYATGIQGMFRSPDAGATWTALGSLPVRVHSVTVDPAASNVLYAGTYGNGIYKSTDTGATWTAINNGIIAYTDGGLYVYHVWIDPRSGAILADTFTGLAGSTDGGATWQTNSYYSGQLGIRDLAFDPNTPGVVYLATLQSIEKSTDDGLTFAALPQPANQSGADSILLDPLHPGSVYTCSDSGGGLFQSTDGGNTWTGKYSYSSAVCRLAADPSTGVLYFGFGPKILASTDGFNTTSLIGPAVSGVTALAAARGHLFAGSQISTDIYVAKFDPQGNILYSTYIGGASDDEASAMAVDAAGSVYLTGTTYSTDFPATAGAYAPIAWGGAFVLKLNPDGSLAYSTGFSGGIPNAIAVDGAGRVLIAGLTYGGLPVTSGAYQTAFQGSSPVFGFGPSPPPPTDAFLTEFDAAGATLVFSTYIGSQNEYASTLALSPDGSILLGGGGKVYRMSEDGSSLLGSATLPGTVWTVTADSAGNIYAGGQTAIASVIGTAPPFPTTAGAFQTNPPPVPILPGNRGNDGDGHAFITRFDSQFHMLASTLLAGEAPDLTLALAADTDGNILAGGSTSSKAFPSRGPAQGSFSPATGWIARLTPDLSTLEWATFAGDTRTFTVRQAIPSRPGGDGGVFFAGATENPPYYSSEGGSFSGLYPSDTTFQSFVVKTAVLPAAPRIDAVVNAASQLGVALAPGGVFQVQGAGFAAGAALLIDDLPLPLLSQTSGLLTAMLPADFVVTGAATIAVQSGGNRSNPFLAAVLAAAPGVYSADGSGLGQGYILNADGTLNSPDNPAKQGSTVTICATGVGASSPDVYIDGVQAGTTATVTGPLGGLPGNVYQVSVQVPAPLNFALPSQVAVSVEANGMRSQAGLALSVGQ